MERHGYLFEKVIDYDNLLLAFLNASKKRRSWRAVVAFASDLEANLLQLLEEIRSGKYRTSPYTNYIIHEPKERLISKLPFRDRITHWDIMLDVEKIWTSVFTRDTYANIKGKGIHPLLRDLRAALKADPTGTAYCLKIDVRKFYPSIDHDLLKIVVREKIKDARLLAMLDEVIDSPGGETGVPIGNYLSQFFANLFLSQLDHLLKEEAKVKYYFRFADDIIILAPGKAELHGLLVYMNHYLNADRLLDMKRNYQVFPVAARGIDYVGYVTYHTHCLARKENKKKLCRQVASLRKRGYSDEEIRIKCASRLGFMKHCDGKHLLKTLNINMKSFSEIANARGGMTGGKYHIDMILDREIHLKGFEITASKFRDSCLTLQYDIFEQLRDSEGNLLNDADGKPLMGWVEHISFTGSGALIKQLEGVVIDEPCAAMIVKQQIGDKGKFFYKLVDPG